jgi:hypothetical protein
VRAHCELSAHPIEDVVQKLIEENRGRSNRHYHCMAVGNADGEQAFYFNPINPSESSSMDSWPIDLTGKDEAGPEGADPALVA